MSGAPDNDPGLFVLGASHHTAPLAVREKLSLAETAAADLHGDLRAIPGLREFAILNTCNRVEFYGVADEPGVAARVQAAFCRRQQFDEAAFARHRVSLHGPQTVRHLLEVAAGLDSQLVGETEIFGQVKEAYAAAQARGSTGPVLNRVFQKAFQAAKHVRTHTAISTGQVSVANVAVELARDIFGDLAPARVLLVGAGEIGEKTARAFQSRGAGSFSVASRRLERAMELADGLGAFALPFWLVPVKLGDFDIVVCATSAPGAVVPAGAVQAAMRRRAARPQLFIDLALPRDVDTAVGELPNVYLYNLDDLAKIASENRAAREAELSRGRALLDERATRLWQDIGPRLAPGTPAPAGEAAPRHQPAS
jgi:glutamyl-tRNA reductase